MSPKQWSETRYDDVATINIVADCCHVFFRHSPDPRLTLFRYRISPWVEENVKFDVDYHEHFLSISQKVNGEGSVDERDVEVEIDLSDDLAASLILRRGVVDVRQVPRTIEVGSGLIHCDGCTVKEEAKFQVNTGSIEGSISIDGTLLKAGVHTGNVRLQVLPDSDAVLKTRISVGAILTPDSSTWGNGKGCLDIDVGVGAINVT